MGFNTESGFNTTLAQKLDAGVADATIILASLPITITEGVMLIGSGTNKEWVYFSTTNAGNVQITGVNRGLDKDATAVNDTTTANILSHRVGDPVRLIQHSFSQNNKPNLDDSNVFTGAKQTFKDVLVDETIEFTDSTTTIRKDGSDMKLKDGNTSEVTLATLAAGAGTDTKVSVTVNDTTPSFLNSKVTVANGIKTTEVNDGGDEDLLFEIDTTTLPSNLDEANTFFGATDATGAEMETLTDGSEAGTLHTHDMVAGRTSLTLDTTGNQDTAIVTVGTPRLIELTILSSSIGNDNAIYTAGSGNSFIVNSDMVFEGATFKSERRYLEARLGTISVQQDILPTFPASNTTFGVTPATNGIQFDITIQNITTTGLDIRVATTETGTGTGSLVILHKIWT